MKNVTSYRRLKDVTFLTYIRRLNDVAELSNNWPQRSPMDRSIQYSHQIHLPVLYTCKLFLLSYAIPDNTGTSNRRKFDVTIRLRMVTSIRWPVAERWRPFVSCLLVFQWSLDLLGN